MLSGSNGKSKETDVLNAASTNDAWGLKTGFSRREPQTNNSDEARFRGNSRYLRVPTRELC